MKWHIALGLTLPMFFLAAHAQESADSGLSTDKQKYSYAIGMQIGNSLSKQGVDLDPDAFAMAIRDVVSGAQPKLSGEEADQIVKGQQVALIKARAEKNAQAGADFRKQYLAGENTKTLGNGILYRVLKEGTGAKPGVNDSVSVNYVGKFVNGKVFDSSENNGGPVSFPLKGIIKGWQETLQLMPEGSKWEIVVPPEMAYGMQGSGPIGPDETLVFVIDLVKIESGKAN